MLQPILKGFLQIQQQQSHAVACRKLLYLLLISCREWWQSNQGLQRQEEAPQEQLCCIWASPLRKSSSAFASSDSAHPLLAPCRDVGGGRGGRGRGGRGDRGRGGRGGGGRGGGGDNTMAADIYKVLRGIKGMNGEPVIIFSFARR